MSIAAQSSVVTAETELELVHRAELVLAAEDSADRRGPFRPETLSPTRTRLSGTVLERVFRTADALTLGLVTLVWASGGRLPLLLDLRLASALPFAAGLLAAIAALRPLGAYGFAAREGLGPHLLKAAVGGLIGGLAAMACSALVWPAGAAYVGLWIGLVLASLSLMHLWAWFSVRRWRRQGRLTPNVVVVGATENAARLIDTALRTRELAVLGVFDDRRGRTPAAVHGVPVLGDTRGLLEHKILPYVDRIVITVTAASQARVRELIHRLRVLPNPVTLFLDLEGHDGRSATLSRLADAPLAHVSGARADERRAILKRAQDLVLGGLLTIAALPVMLIIAIAVKLDSPGPVLFRQRRHGFNNETITVWKFRSMRHDAADVDCERQVSVGDERVTRIGRFIRRTSLDELPQLLNVLRGEMSLVGPRPHAVGMKTAGEPSARFVAEYAWRHRMKPGLTGWAQINGSRGPVETPDAVRRRWALDIEYIERQSFWFDLYILAMTLPRLLGDRHAVR